MRPDLASPLAVVCHDAGACNLILPWIAGSGLALRPVMQGPAARLFAERFPQRLSLALDDALDGASMLLSGSGWASDLEHRARARARARGLRSVAVIDHWVNYAERFERDGEVVWPDEFWVTDDEAVRLASATFPGAVVRHYDNLYLEAQLARIGPAPRNGGVLVVLEPARSDWGRGTPGEFQALDHFMAQRAALGIGRGVAIRLRPHPSDPPGKYDAWIAAQRGADVALDRHAALADAIGASRWVAGCESMAMVVALHAGRPVIGMLPPWAPRCRLPQRGITHLRDLQPA
jgi:hypothetical protein